MRAAANLNNFLAKDDHLSNYLLSMVLWSSSARLTVCEIRCPYPFVWAWEAADCRAQTSSRWVWQKMDAAGISAAGRGSQPPNSILEVGISSRRTPWWERIIEQTTEEEMIPPFAPLPRWFAPCSCGLSFAVARGARKLYKHVGVELAWGWKFAYMWIGPLHLFTATYFWTERRCASTGTLIQY